MQLWLVCVLLVAAASGVASRPQGYETDPGEEIPPLETGGGGGEEDGRQGRTFGLVKKGYHFLKNRFFNRPNYYSPYAGAPYNNYAYNNYPYNPYNSQFGFEQQPLSSNLPLTPFAL